MIAEIVRILYYFPLTISILNDRHHVPGLFVRMQPTLLWLDSSQQLRDSTSQ